MKLANEFAKRGGGNFYSLARSAFTLAEILITLGIVGVVAALTIPGLMTAYKAHQLRSQFLKSYSTIQQVFRRMEADDISLSKESWVGNQLFAINYSIWILKLYLCVYLFLQYGTIYC